MNGGNTMNYDHEYFDRNDGQITKVKHKQRKFFANASFLGHLKPTVRNTNKAMHTNKNNFARKRSIPFQSNPRQIFGPGINNPGCF